MINVDQRRLGEAKRNPTPITIHCLLIKVSPLTPKFGGIHNQILTLFLPPHPQVWGNYLYNKMA